MSHFNPRHPLALHMGPQDLQSTRPRTQKSPRVLLAPLGALISALQGCTAGAKQHGGCSAAAAASRTATKCWADTWQLTGYASRRHGQAHLWPLPSPGVPLPPWCCPCTPSSALQAHYCSTAIRCKHAEPCRAAPPAAAQTARLSRLEAKLGIDVCWSHELMPAVHRAPERSPAVVLP